MKDRKQIPLPDNAEQMFLFLNASRVLRLECQTSESGYNEGVVTSIDVEYGSKVKVKCRYDNGTDATLSLYYAQHKKTWETTSGSRVLVCYEAEVSRAGAPMATPVEPAKPKEEFSNKGVMPSDHPGINDMLKKGFKEIFGGDIGGAQRGAVGRETVPAPAKRTLPSSKALFITASERYMGLGFNDELNVPREA